MSPLLLLFSLIACTLPIFGGEDTKKNPSSDDSVSSDDTGNGGNNQGGFCSQHLSTSAPGGPDCVTDTISCGQQIEGRIQGGEANLEESMYEDWFCGYPFPSDYSGPERVYLLDVDQSTLIDVTLESPCDEVDLIAIHWTDNDCPRQGVGISECESSWDNGDDFLELYTDRAYRFYLVVEPRRGSDANFRLSVECTNL